LNELTYIEIKQLISLIDDANFTQGLSSVELNEIIVALNIDFSTLSYVDLKNTAGSVTNSKMINALTDDEITMIYNALCINFAKFTDPELIALASSINNTIFLDAFTDEELTHMQIMADDLAVLMTPIEKMTNDQFESLFALISNSSFLYGYTSDELLEFANIIDEGAYWVSKFPDIEAEEIVDMINNLSYVNPVGDPLNMPNWENGIFSDENPTFPVEWDIYNLDNPIYVPNKADQCFMFFTIWINVLDGNTITDQSNQVMIRYFINDGNTITPIEGSDVLLGLINDHILYDIGFLSTILTVTENKYDNAQHEYFDGLTNDYSFAALNKKDFINRIKNTVDANEYIKFNKTDSNGDISGVILTPKAELLTYINENIPMLPDGTDEQLACFPTPYAEEPEPQLDIILYDRKIMHEDEPAMNKLYRTSPVEKYNIDRTSDSSYKYECLDLGMLYSGFYKTLLKSCSFVKKVDRILFDPKAFLQLPYFQAIDSMYIESYLLLFNDQDILMKSNRNWTTTIPEKTFNNLLIPFVIENLLLIDTAGEYSIMDKESLNSLTYDMQFINKSLRESGFRSIIIDCSPIWTTRIYYDYINIVETLFRKE